MTGTPSHRLLSSLLTYECLCGQAFLVGLGAEGGAPGAVVRDVARRLASGIGREYIDGRRRGFSCPTCSRLHVQPPAGSRRSRVDVAAAN